MRGKLISGISACTFYEWLHADQKNGKGQNTEADMLKARKSISCPLIS
jgi:hypothetical protein